MTVAYDRRKGIEQFPMEKVVAWGSTGLMILLWEF
jgi:hypothetical protein